MSIEVKWEKRVSGKPTAKPPAEKRTNILKPAIGGAVILIVAAVFLVWPRAKSSGRNSPEKIASAALEALANGNRDEFLNYIDVKTFVSRMDSTGVTRRDYAEAASGKQEELMLVHAEILTGDIFINANTGRNYQIVDQDIKESSAGFTIKPWIQLGNKLYKRLLLEKHGDQWQVIGLASPDA